MNKKIVIIGGLVFMGLIYKLPSILFANAYEYDEIIKKECEEKGLPFSLVKGLIATESGFNPNAKASTSSATGLMQMTAPACSDVNISHTLMVHPEYAIKAGCEYLARMVKSTGGLYSGVRAYYEGLGNYRKNTDSDPLNDRKERHIESKNYLYKVLSYQLAFLGGK